jgi:ribosomal protein S16
MTIFTVLFPRYVTAACCSDSNHVSNRLDPEFLTEISRSEKCLTEAAAAGKRTSEARILNMLGFFGPLESPLQDLTTVDGASIWAGDGVHLTSNASRVAAQKLMHHIATDGAGGEPANKRARLESVVPTHAAPNLPKQKTPLPPPLWLSGQLPAVQRGRGASGIQRGPQKGGRGGYPTYQGSGPPASRGGTRGRPRDGPRGRCGRW